jgi:hypothetical protein
MKRCVASIVAGLIANWAVAGSSIDNVSALRTAADFAERAGNDVSSMDAKVALYRPSHKRPPEYEPVPKEVEAAMNSGAVWRVLFYVDVTKSIGLRGRSICVYVAADTGKPVGSLFNCTI